MTNNRRKPCPLFDTLPILKETQEYSWLSAAQNRDFQQARQFLLCYKDNATTYNAYRREIERLLQWCQLRANKTLKQLRRDDIDVYIRFCQKPLKSWIALKKVPRFIQRTGKRIPNPEWRPFVVTLPKSQISIGEEPNIENYKLSEKSVREIFTVTSSFFNFLIQEDYAQINPVQQIRQKSKYFKRHQTKKIVRKLSELQWGYVIKAAYTMADKNKNHERTLFIMNTLYGMYLRISELVARDNWLPKMGDFQRDQDGLWWFTTVGKGNKERQIAVSTAMMKALKRWRKHLNLNPLPSPGEKTPLIPKQVGIGPITSTRPIRVLVQNCFDRAVRELVADGFQEDANQLMNATVHWLRHTGISDDVKIRPREHVRDDAGHSSGHITDQYIDVGLRERYQTAKKKSIIPEDFLEEISTD